MEETVPSALHQNSHLNVNYTLDNYKLGDLPIPEILNLKKSLQDELFRLGDVLKKDYKVTMDTSLFTFDGFPRSDIDIVGITYIRNRIIVLRNDFEKVMQTIEASLQNHFSSDFDEKADKDSKFLGKSILGKPAGDNNHTVPFVVVQDILPMSPSFRASLQIGDKIVEFGKLNYGNTVNIKNKNGKIMEIGRFIKNLQEKPIPLKVIRGSENQIVELTLTPSTNWDGLGLLGCKLVQI